MRPACVHSAFRGFLLLFAFLILTMLVETGCGAGMNGVSGFSGAALSGRQSAPQTVSSPSTAVYAYVGSNAFQSDTGYISKFNISDAGLAGTAIGAVTTGPSGSLVANSGYVVGTDGKYISTYARGANGSLQLVST